MTEHGNKSYDETLLQLSREDSRLPEEAFGLDTYDLYCVPIETYEKYKNDVQLLGLAFQKWTAPDDDSLMLNKASHNHLCDREMAEELGIDTETVRKIRCMSDWDLPPEAWRNAAEFKRMRRLERPYGGTKRDMKSEPA